MVHRLASTDHLPAPLTDGFDAVRARAEGVAGTLAPRAQRAWETARDRVGTHVEEAWSTTRDRVGPYVDDARGTVLPAVSSALEEAREALAPAAATTATVAREEIWPRLSEALTMAERASEPARSQARARGLAALAALRGEPPVPAHQWAATAGFVALGFAAGAATGLATTRRAPASRHEHAEEPVIAAVPTDGQPAHGS